MAHCLYEECQLDETGSVILGVSSPKISSPGNLGQHWAPVSTSPRASHTSTPDGMQRGRRGIGAGQGESWCPGQFHYNLTCPGCSNLHQRPSTGFNGPRKFQSKLPSDTGHRKPMDQKHSSTSPSCQECSTSSLPICQALGRSQGRCTPPCFRPWLLATSQPPPFPEGQR